jgi:8-amino-7-oxononanoate synthase
MIWDELQGELDTLAGEGLKRRRRVLDSPCGPVCTVDGREVISFCSNDYLGLANDPHLIATAQAAAAQWGVGSGASHLVSGHLRPHEALESALAEFVGFPRALSFSTGYMANLAIVPALVGRGDAVFSDKLNHASLIDAAQLTHADSRRYAHGDIAALSAMLEASTARRKLILTDAVCRCLASDRRCAWLWRTRRARARQPLAFQPPGQQACRADGNARQGGRRGRCLCCRRCAGHRVAAATCPQLHLHHRR